MAPTTTQAHPGEVRTVNQILGTRPSLGPIPADQFMPWVGLLVLTMTVTQGILPLCGLDVGWMPTVVFAAWLCSTYYVLTYRRAWGYLGKFQNRPRWVLGHQRYLPLTFADRHTADGGEG
ncbi:hypothetical protein [Gloeobacter morelensis]|uniref:hypothetical protein n=1 Tax=Gloeobacter morelensis TaxID=2907343 RepID=UPI001E5882E3|nr:hypothetical protein [Gloeobacter morelensis]UFP97142.1 hypothetical protein ISF26_23765 [Gloeobacter morelensis MG652769]